MRQRRLLHAGNPQEEAAAGPAVPKKGKNKAKEQYTIKSFEAHAVLIDRLWHHKNDNDLEALVTAYVTPEDAAKATGVVTILPPKRLEELKAESRQFAPGEARFNALTECLPAWVEAFRSGPDCRTSGNTTDLTSNPFPPSIPRPDPLAHQFHKRLNITTYHRGRQDHDRLAPKEEDLIDDNQDPKPKGLPDPEFCHSPDHGFSLPTDQGIIIYQLQGFIAIYPKTHLGSPNAASAVDD